MKKRASSLLLAICMALSLVLIPNVQAAPKKKIALSNKTITMKVGQKKTLKLKNYKKISKKAIKKVKWTSSNKKVVTVKYSGKYRQEGKLTAKKKGTSYIKVKFNGKTYKCKVTVKEKSNTTTENRTTERVTTEQKTTEKVTTEKATTEQKTTTEETPDTSNEKPTEHIHNWGVWTVLKAETCEEDGEMTRVCDQCGRTERKAIKALGHDWNNGVVTTEPTCSKNGFKTYTCLVCGDIKTETIAATGIHSYDEYGTYKEATYSLYGIEYPMCSSCGELNKVDKKRTPCTNKVSCIERQEIDDNGGYYPITGGGSFKYKIYELATNVSDIYFLSKDTNKRCSISIEAITKNYNISTVDVDDISSFKFTIKDGENIVEKTYSYSDLSKLFTPSNQLAVLQKIYGNRRGTEYNDSMLDKTYNQGGYAGSIDTALIEVPRGYEYSYQYNDEFRNVSSSGEIYINGMAMAIICNDMGYLCTGGFYCYCSYLIN